MAGDALELFTRTIVAYVHMYEFCGVDDTGFSIPSVVVFLGARDICSCVVLVLVYIGGEIKTTIRTGWIVVRPRSLRSVVGARVSTRCIGWFLAVSGRLSSTLVKRGFGEAQFGGGVRVARRDGLGEKKVGWVSSF